MKTFVIISSHSRDSCIHFAMKVKLDDALVFVFCFLFLIQLKIVQRHIARCSKSTTIPSYFLYGRSTWVYTWKSLCRFLAENKLWNESSDETPFFFFRCWIFNCFLVLWCWCRIMVNRCLFFSLYFLSYRLPVVLVLLVRQRGNYSLRYRGDMTEQQLPQSNGKNQTIIIYALCHIPTIYFYHFVCAFIILNITIGRMILYIQ
jgi:Mn2+/Fe2+ NRAMP family transporter